MEEARMMRIPKVDFTDENVFGIRGGYTSFESSPQPRKPSVIPQQSNVDRIQRPTCSSNAMNFRSTTSKNLGNKHKPGVTRPFVVDTYDVQVDPDSLVCFYGRESFLSNFHTAPIVINKHTYPTIEHFYEACKLFAFGGPTWAAILQHLKDPGAVKTTVRRVISGLDRKLVERWKRNAGLEVMEYGLMHKFTQHTELRDKLLATGDALLVHSNPYETLWASGIGADKVKEWATAKRGSVLKVPKEISNQTIPSLPIICVKGQNALGYLLMNTRAKLRQHQRTTLNVVKEEDNAEEPVAAVNVDDLCVQLAKSALQQNHAHHQHPVDCSAAVQSDAYLADQ